jgi:hypothetical protein
LASIVNGTSLTRGLLALAVLETWQYLTYVWFMMELIEVHFWDVTFPT